MHNDGFFEFTAEPHDSQRSWYNSNRVSPIEASNTRKFVKKSRLLTNNRLYLKNCTAYTHCVYANLSGDIESYGQVTWDREGHK